jgi:hypothetical protein
MAPVLLNGSFARRVASAVYVAVGTYGSAYGLGWYRPGSGVSLLDGLVAPAGRKTMTWPPSTRVLMCGNGR